MLFRFEEVVFIYIWLQFASINAYVVMSGWAEDVNGFDKNNFFVGQDGRN